MTHQCPRCGQPTFDPNEICNACYCLHNDMPMVRLDEEFDYTKQPTFKRPCKGCGKDITYIGGYVLQRWIEMENAWKSEYTCKVCDAKGV